MCKDLKAGMKLKINPIYFLNASNFEQFIHACVSIEMFWTL